MPSPGPTYHVIAFERRFEAAAFVAALSRTLDAARPSDAGPASRPIEVWSGPPGPGEALALYLSDAAWRAAAASFAPVPAAPVRSGLPANCRRILDAQSPAWGVEEALSRLSGAASARDDS